MNKQRLREVVENEIKGMLDEDPNWISLNDEAYEALDGTQALDNFIANAAGAVRMAADKDVRTILYLTFFVGLTSGIKFAADPQAQVEEAQVEDRPVTV